jgi:hypothetical protein
MSQLLMMSASRVGIGLCAIGTFDFEPVRQHLALDQSQVLMHTLVGGPLDDSQSGSVDEEVHSKTPPEYIARVNVKEDREEFDL